MGRLTRGGAAITSNTKPSGSVNVCPRNWTSAAASKPCPSNSNPQNHTESRQKREKNPRTNRSPQNIPDTICCAPSIIELSPRPPYHRESSCHGGKNFSEQLPARHVPIISVASER